MSKLNIIILDNLDNEKDEIQINKPKTYKEFLKYLSNENRLYEIFIYNDNNKIKIHNEDKYKIIKDVIFIKEIDKLDKSIFSINYDKLSESIQEIIDDKYNCNICSIIIKKENPFLCYKCQKIFHEKCLKEWDIKCKFQDKILECPNCRNELSIENWNKKLDYEENRKENANLLNKINEYESMINNINTIKDKKIKKYENYINKTIILFKKIQNKLNKLLNNMIKNNNKLKELINNNLNIDIINDISNMIYEELDKINKIIYNNKINNDIKYNNQIKNDNKINNELNEYKNEINLIYDENDKSNNSNIDYQSNSNNREQIYNKSLNNFMMEEQYYADNENGTQSQISNKARMGWGYHNYSKNEIKLYLKEVKSKLDTRSFHEFIRNIKILVSSKVEPNDNRKSSIEKIRNLLLEKDSELFEKFKRIIGYIE